MTRLYRRTALAIAILVLVATSLGACGTAAPTATPTAPPRALLATETAGKATLTILYDNYVDDSELESGWGFACLVETAGSTVLFDTGASGESLLKNMAALGKDPLAVDAVVLSHAHDDHTAGLASLLAVGARPKVYLLSSFAADYLQMVRTYTEPVVVVAPAEIASGIYTTGRVSGQVPEQALIVHTGEGLTVVTGCAHPGVVKMVQQAMDATGQQVTLVLGGFHLADASESRVNAIIDQLRGLGVKRVGPSHCSGDGTRTLFAASYGDGNIALGVGRVVVVGP
jgi:7,8-dihydropterin-6-yl-methyl-4-(beta-D-ribofuranosyl)aminobenzene 5'-phosphate synthase